MNKHNAFSPSAAASEVMGQQDIEATDHCPSLTTGHQDPAEAER